MEASFAAQGWYANVASLCQSHALTKTRPSAPPPLGPLVPEHLHERPWAVKPCQYLLLVAICMYALMTICMSAASIHYSGWSRSRQLLCHFLQVIINPKLEMKYKCTSSLTTSQQVLMCLCAYLDIKINGQVSQHTNSGGRLWRSNYWGISEKEYISWRGTKALRVPAGCLRGMTVAVHTQGGSVETVKTQRCGMLLSPELAT